MLAISVSTASTERGFSTMNLTKTCLRTCLDQEVLNMLMTIAIDGPPMQSFNPETSIQHWLDSGPGTRHVEHQLLLVVAHDACVNSHHSNS